MLINFEPIGYLFTPFTQRENMPIQPSGERAAKGHAEINPELTAGLKDLEAFSHLILIYYFHEQSRKELCVKPFLDDAVHGVFATRAPSRPNFIGVSVVPLLKIDKNILYFDKLDMLNKTPLLDIKPLVPKFDFYQQVKTGWLEHGGNHKVQTSDKRFV